MRRGRSLPRWIKQLEERIRRLEEENSIEREAHRLDSGRFARHRSRSQSLVIPRHRQFDDQGRNDERKIPTSNGLEGSAGFLRLPQLPHALERLQGSATTDHRHVDLLELDNLSHFVLETHRYALVAKLALPVAQPLKNVRNACHRHTEAAAIYSARGARSARAGPDCLHPAD